MTKQDKIYKACELIEINKERFSCIAIMHLFSWNIRLDYESFLGSDWPWPSLLEPLSIVEHVNYKSIRILAMLLFLETEPESLDK